MALALVLGLAPLGWAQNVFDPLNGQLLTNAQLSGVTSFPDGSTWGITGIGLIPSSTFSFQDGSSWSANGPAISPTSKIRFSDGSIWTRDGLLASADSTIGFPDGSLWTPIGLQFNPSRRLQLGVGALVHDATRNGLGVQIAGSSVLASTATALRVPAGSSTVPGLSDVTSNNAGLWFASHKLGLRGQLTQADGGTAPSITAGCGTAPSIAGTNNAMLITVGTGGVATSCTVTFGTAYVTNPPVCTANSDTDKVGLAVAPTTTTVVVSATAAFTASSKLNVLCLGRI